MLLLLDSQPQALESRDHVLLVVKAVVNGTCVPALIDSGASRSFVSDQLQCHNQLQFVGAYLALELANGETIVSTGIAPRVLVCIGSVPCRLALTAVPMMEGVQLILGKDWLDIMNPLVDWRSNTVYLRNGSQLEPVQGIREKSGTHCQIVDKGLNGLQHYFRDLKQGERTPTADLAGKVATLRSPSFWRYEPSTNEWVSVASSKKAAVPQGGGGGGYPILSSLSSNDKETSLYQESKRVQAHKNQEGGWEVCQAACQAKAGFYIDATGSQACEQNGPAHVFVCLEGHRTSSEKKTAKVQSWCGQRHDRGRKEENFKGDRPCEGRGTD